MEDIDDGGSAFGEFIQAGQNAVKKGGLTVRDYFAARAMAGMEVAVWSDCEWIAEKAFEIADAMIAERNKRKGSKS